MNMFLLFELVALQPGPFHPAIERGGQKGPSYQASLRGHDHTLRVHREVLH